MEDKKAKGRNDINENVITYYSLGWYWLLRLFTFCQSNDTFEREREKERKRRRPPLLIDFICYTKLTKWIYHIYIVINYLLLMRGHETIIITQIDFLLIIEILYKLNVSL